MTQIEMAGSVGRYKTKLTFKSIVLLCESLLNQSENNIDLN